MDVTIKRAYNAYKCAYGKPGSSETILITAGDQTAAVDWNGVLKKMTPSAECTVEEVSPVIAHIRVSDPPRVDMAIERSRHLWNVNRRLFHQMTP